MKRLLIPAFQYYGSLARQNDALPEIHFNGMDLSRINGQSRFVNPVLSLRKKAKGQNFLTGSAYPDADYISFTRCRDNATQISLCSVEVDDPNKNMIQQLPVSDFND